VTRRKGALRLGVARFQPKSDGQKRRQVIVDEVKAYIALGDLDALRDAFAELCDAVVPDPVQVDAIVHAISAQDS
jgi:hypothetical protein